MLRDAAQHIVSIVAVGVDKKDAVALGDVAEHLVLENGGLAGAAHAGDVCVHPLQDTPQSCAWRRGGCVG